MAQRQSAHPCYSPSGTECARAPSWDSPRIRRRGPMINRFVLLTYTWKRVAEVTSRQITTEGVCCIDYVPGEGYPLRPSGEHRTGCSTVAV